MRRAFKNIKTGLIEDSPVVPKQFMQKYSQDFKILKLDDDFPSIPEFEEVKPLPILLSSVRLHVLHDKLENNVSSDYCFTKIEQNPKLSSWNSNKMITNFTFDKSVKRHSIRHKAYSKLANDQFFNSFNQRYINMIDKLEYL